MIAIQQLIYRSERWPWKWFKVFREAASIAKQERSNFSILQSEHLLLKLEADELRKHRLTDAEKLQQLRDELQSLTATIRDLEIKTHIQEMELKSTKHEQSEAVAAYERAMRGNRVYSEYIRRNQVVASNGKPIPEMPRFTNIFRQ